MQISPFNFFPVQRTCTLHYSLIGLLTSYACKRNFEQEIENYRPPPSLHTIINVYAAQISSSFSVHYAAAAVMKEQQKQPQLKKKIASVDVFKKK